MNIDRGVLNRLLRQWQLEAARIDYARTHNPNNTISDEISRAMSIQLKDCAADLERILER